MMSAKIIDGKAIAEKILEEATTTVASAKQKPGLAVLIVGDNPASHIYVRNKIRACEKTGILSHRIDLPASSSENIVLEKIVELNQNPDIHGILVQLPLPPHIDEKKALETINPEKDVDGFHMIHMGSLVADMPSLSPCTPKGCMALLKESKIPIEGANAVVIGRSCIVGKPMMLMLLNEGATVTVCHSKTKNLSEITRNADILVVAVGRPKMITADIIKNGATVIDVGINRLENGKIAGDVDFEQVLSVAGAITPVPGGVGPMTIAMLVKNTMQAAKIG